MTDCWICEKPGQAIYKLTDSDSAHYRCDKCQVQWYHGPERPVKRPDYTTWSVSGIAEKVPFVDHSKEYSPCPA